MCPTQEQHTALSHLRQPLHILARSLNYEQMLPLQLAVSRFHDNQNLFNAQRANHTCIPKLQLNKRRVEKITRKHINNLQFTEYSIHSTQLKS